MVKKEDLAAGVVTKEEVYTPDIACMMWLVFGARARKLGYTLPPWIKREECRTMRYDWSLVLPGRIAQRRKKEFGAAGAQQKEGDGDKEGDGGKEPAETVAAEKK